MRKMMLAMAGLALTAAPALPAVAQDWHGDHGHHDYHSDRGRHDYHGGYGGYDAAAHYHGNHGHYAERRLGPNDRIYRGRDGRYYCRRSNGTTGLIVGGLAGGALGNVIASGGSKTLGTLLGAGGGALLGRSIDRNNVRCR